MEGWDGGETGWVEIGDREVVIWVWGKGNYRAYSYSGKEILKITKSFWKGINTLT